MEEPFSEEEDEERPRGGRAIVLIDLDRFYAQVEMLRNPGIQIRTFRNPEKENPELQK